MEDIESELAVLRSRVESLETRLAALEPAPGREVARHGPAPGFPAPPPPGAVFTGAPPPLPPPAPAAGPARPLPSLTIDAETVFKWTGLALVVLAAVFLVSAAISRGWIGPELQLAGATAGGLGLVAWGWQLESRNRMWAEALLIGGAIVLPLCAAASNAGLDLLGPAPALVWLAATVAALAAVAAAREHESVAWVSALASVVLVMWVADHTDLAVVVVGTWLTATGLGFGALSLARRWVTARLVVMTASGLMLLSATASNDALAGGELGLALVAGAMLAIALWAGPAVAAWLNGSFVGPMAALDRRSVIHAPLGYWVFVGIAVRFEDSTPFGWLGVALALGSAGLAVAVSRRSPEPLLITHLMGASMLASAALAVLADGPVLLASFAVQAAVLAVLAHRFDDVLPAAQAAVMGVISLGWAGAAMTGALFEPASVGQHLVDFLVVALVIGASVYAHRLRLGSMVALSAAVGWIGSLLWLATVTIHGPQGQVVVSILWALAAAGAVAVGVRQGSNEVRAVGLATLSVVLVKLLTIDLAEVDTLWRVGLFFVIGTGLLRLGYLLPSLSVAGRTDEDAASRGDGDLGVGNGDQNPGVVDGHHGPAEPTGPSPLT